MPAAATECLHGICGHSPVKRHCLQGARVRRARRRVSRCWAESVARLSTSPRTPGRTGSGGAIRRYQGLDIERCTQVVAVQTPRPAEA